MKGVVMEDNKKNNPDKILPTISEACETLITEDGKNDLANLQVLSKKTEEACDTLLRATKDFVAWCQENSFEDWSKIQDRDKLYLNFYSICKDVENRANMLLALMGKK